MIIRAKISKETEVMALWSLFQVEGDNTFDNIIKNIASGMIYLIHLLIYTYEFCAYLFIHISAVIVTLLGDSILRNGFPGNMCSMWIK